MKCQNFFSVQFLFRLFLIFVFFTKFSTSCCCDCCCGCCCCDCGCCCGCGCCGGGGGCCRGNNNQLASLLGQLSLGSQQPQPAIQEQAASSVLGPDLLPDGSTDRGNNQRISETENIFGNNDQFKRRKRRRKRGIVGRIEHTKGDKLLNIFECIFKSLREEREKRQMITMPYLSSTKIPSKYLPSDWSPDNIKTNEAQTSIGPGLLPDGSISQQYSNQNKNLMGNDNSDDYFGGNEFFGGNSQNNNWQLKRRRRRQLNFDGQKPWFGCWPPGTLFTCQLLLARRKRNENKNIFQLGLVPLENIKQNNTTFLNFLLGIIPENKEKSWRINRRKKRNNNFPSTKDAGEFEIQKRIFLFPEKFLDIKKEENNKRFKKRLFYKTIISNPEREQEKTELDFD
uniref:Uncharacterized protein n=1 Tax=Meloidogyne enterolobii TaxID=390850 RepID=A0A6V7WDE5_MELEN|nr:unnamed protein product [Meloidogyne enterolobii]